ncbi:uncharacterized protein LOC128230937 [Mya arenaria]|uniref:uncharacterized protein LOC128230937 n=1 Tax=Mya arenaria TaxID=6604 RepID=UPI0022DF5AD0|nr:uncharacterized protein LOC128230937 [Mya arenaria]
MFSGLSATELLPENPGQYIVYKCSPPDDVTISIGSHQSLVVPVTDFTSTATFTLQCSESLYMVRHPQLKFRKEGEDVKLSCEAYSEPGNQPITYSWKKNGVMVTGGVNGELVKTQLKIVDNGFYVCTAAVESQGIKVPSREAALVVGDFESYYLIPEQKTVCESDVTVNTCSQLPCVPPGYSYTDDQDAGQIDVATMQDLFVDCGSATVALKDAVTCECTKAAAPTLTVTVMDVTTNAPLADVEVRIAGTSAQLTTDADGKATLAVPAGILTAVLQVTKTSSEYLPSTRPVDIDGTSKSITVYLYKKAAPVQLQPDIENTISLSDDPLNPNKGAVTFEIPANSFFHRDGGNLVPPVELSLTYIEPTVDNVENAPGVFFSTDENGNIVPIETQGVFVMTATDANGEPLDSAPITVISKDGFALFILNGNGQWTLIPPTSGVGRRRRQTSNVGTAIGNITITSNQVRWYNIDKFPENTRCWFKTYVKDAATDNALQDPQLRRYAVATSLQSSGITSILQLSDFTTNMDTCFEARCDNNATGSLSKGYIVVDALGIVASIRNRATPMVLSDYAAAVQTRLNTLQFNIDAQDRLTMDLEASANGPFFYNKTTCESASFASDDNVLGFTVDNPSTNSDPYGDSNDRCVARVKVNITYGGYLGENTTFTAISLWGANLFYKQYNTTFDNSTSTAILCFNYRCSMANDLTNVVISFTPDRNGDNFLYEYVYGCNITLTAPVINQSTGNGYFLNTSGDVQAPLDICNAETDSDPFALEKNCPDWEKEIYFE